MKAQDYAARIGKNTLLLASAAALGYVISFFYKIVLARMLGPVDFGAFALLMTIATALTSILTLGIPSALTKYVSEYLAAKKPLHVLLSTALTTMLGLGAFAFLSVYVLAPYIGSVLGLENYIFQIRLVGLAAALGIFTSYFSGVTSGLQRFRLTFFGTLIDRSSKLGVTVLLLYLGFGTTGAVLGLMASSIFGALYLIWKTFDVSVAPSKVDTANLRTVIAFGLPVFVGSVGSLFLGWTDTFMLGYFLDAASVGYYNAAIPIIWFLNFPISALSTVLFPVYSELNAKKSKTTMNKTFNRALKYAAGLLLPASVGMFLLADPIVRVVFGIEYLPAVGPLKVLSFVALLNGVSYFLGIFFSGLGNPKIFMKFTLVGATLNIVLNYFLIPVYGIVGAAMASLAATAVILILLLVKVRSHLSFNIRPFVKIAGATLVMSVIVVAILALALPGILKVALVTVLGALSYFAILIALKVFDSEDKESFGKLVKVVKSKIVR